MINLLKVATGNGYTQLKNKWHIYYVIENLLS
ncbi:hypothetical protein GA0116948_10443 [Chitinophaga costaii]|uniref:Uncharacterized protein n=1 Tax=Chitinophaga costaii TaxID=1335309 RepID=A0A1C4CB33_9BACT|nr:hypothetical protein GA0116948_10443 [Chitinophaga costaii]